MCSEFVVACVQSDITFLITFQHQAHPLLVNKMIAMFDRYLRFNYTKGFNFKTYANLR